MNIVKCENDHFFNLEKFEKCPVCGASAKSEYLTSNQNDASKSDVRSIDQFSEKTLGIFGDESKVSDETHQNDQPENNKVRCSNGHFYNASIYDACPHCGSERLFGSDNEEDKSDSNEQDHFSESIGSDSYDSADIDEDNASDDANSSGTSLKDELARLTSYSGGKTVGFFGIAKKDSEMNEPVVGWLVCIGGTYFGDSFTIRNGKNSIGRNTNNDIVLTKEMSVSRERHAYVTFDRKNNEFFVQAGDSHSLTYHNGNTVLSFEKLQNGDIVEIGECKLMFIPLCGEDFSWEKYL